MKNIQRQMSLFAVDSELESWIRDIRRTIHAYPELSFQEKITSQYVGKKLQELGISYKNGIAGTGILATLPSSVATNREAVALRADMDALPIQEETNVGFASQNTGVMHACGHDGHVAMLLGAAALLLQKKLPGPVNLIFQPAEEHGNGAEKLVHQNILDDTGAVFGGHIDTHFSVGTITVDEGIVCAWADPFQIKISGRSGHAARPHEAVDALVAAANLVVSLQTLVSRGVDPNRAAVVTIGSLHAGTAQNVIAKEAFIQGTVRTTDPQSRDNVLAGLQRMVASIGSMYGVIVELSFHGSIPAVINDASMAALARSAAYRTCGATVVGSQGASSLGAEDFAFYQQARPGCMVRFGASKGESIGVSHSGTYDFDEDVLSLGASWYANAAWQWLCSRYGRDEE